MTKELVDLDELDRLRASENKYPTLWQRYLALEKERDELHDKLDKLCVVLEIVISLREELEELLKT